MCHNLTRVRQKVRHREYLLVWQLFVQSNSSYKKRKQWPTFPHSHSEGSCNCQNMLSLNACLQHLIPRFANGTTVRQLLVNPHKLGICDHEDAYSEGQKDIPYFSDYKTHFFPEKCDLKSTCVLYAEGKYLFPNLGMSLHLLYNIFIVR